MIKSIQEIINVLNDDYTVLKNNVDLEKATINDICYDSRRVKPGNLFVCIIGENTDSHEYVSQAVENGASCVLAQKVIEGLSVPVVIVENTVRVMGLIANIIEDYPSKQLKLIGVTGTNGKTTVTHLVEKILEKADKTCGLIGTLGNRASSSKQYDETKHTTPQSPELQKYLRSMIDQGISYTVMEVSSHALEQDRVIGCEFDTAIITNITQDHLDFHITMDNYTNAKLKLFTSLNTNNKAKKTAIINLDDPSAQKFIDAMGDSVEIITYGISSDADIVARDIEYSFEGTVFTCKSKCDVFEIRLKLKGQFSVYNSLAAIAAALSEEIAVETIQAALSEVENVAGRFEVVSQKPLVIVDYAHTPDGLENILSAARDLVPSDGKLITVFGCGGDRDPTKRPKMGRIAQEYSDKIIITSDNPRTEDPQQIITDILAGLKSLNNDRTYVELDRYQAISLAVKEANDSDVLVVAGKGHEDYQILKNETIHFDDREVVRSLLTSKSINALK